MCQRTRSRNSARLLGGSLSFFGLLFRGCGSAGRLTHSEQSIPVKLAGIRIAEGVRALGCAVMSEQQEVARLLQGLRYFLPASSPGTKW